MFTYCKNINIITLPLIIIFGIMSRKGCLVSLAVFFVIIILFISCGILCFLFVKLTSNFNTDYLYKPESETLTYGGKDKVVVIDVEGIIVDADSEFDFWGADIASSGKIVNYIDNAMKDEDVKAIILNLNTPGGDVYASDVIYNKIKEAKSKGIKVITLMRGIATSGGYYISSPSDKIVANELTITGSIGVYMEFQSLGGLYEKLGIKTRVITNSRGNYKTGEGLFDDDPEGEEDKIYQKLVDDAYSRFVEVIADGRGLTKEEIYKFADGRIMSGKQALDFKLVDFLGGFDDAVSIAGKEANIENPTVIKYKEYDFFKSLMGYVSTIVNPTSRVMELVDTTPGIKLRYLYVE